MHIVDTSTGFKTPFILRTRNLGNFGSILFVAGKERTSDTKKVSDPTKRNPSLARSLEQMINSKELSWN